MTTKRMAFNYNLEVSKAVMSKNNELRKKSNL